MELKKVMNLRRAYRDIKKISISKKLIDDLAKYASLAPSCFNKQPWKFIFVKDSENLNKLYKTLSKGNEWVYNSSMIVAVVSKKEFDCIIKEREYYLFDTGMATAFMILRATDLGLVAHPIAGYNEEQAKKILHIPDDMRLIAMLVIGKKTESKNPDLSDFQIKAEKERPERLPLKKFVFLNNFEK